MNLKYEGSYSKNDLRFEGCPNDVELIEFSYTSAMGTLDS